MYLSSNFHRAVKFCICLQVFTSSKIFHFHDFSTVAQKCHGNFNLTHGNFNLLTAISIQFDSRQCQFTHGIAHGIFRFAHHLSTTAADWDELRPVWVYIGLHTFLFRHTFTWDRPKNELRPVWLHLDRWSDPSYFRTGLKPYRSNVKQKNESQTGSISSMFLRLAPPFLLFLSKNRNTVSNNISKQALEVASMLG